MDLQRFNYIFQVYSITIRFSHCPVRLYQSDETTGPEVEKRSKQIVVFLDDGLGYAESFQKAKEHSAQVKVDLLNAGFVPNVQKSKWDPVSETEWLGLIINLNNGSLVLPHRRIISIKSAIQELLTPKLSASSTWVKVRELASIAGKIVSSYLAAGSMSRIMTKGMHSVIESRDSWNSEVLISEQAKEELWFWLHNIDNHKETPLQFTPRCSRIAFSDASKNGFAGYIVDVNNSITHGLWAENEKKRSSTWRELKAIEMVLSSQINKFKNSRVKWFSDNQAVTRIVSKGSMKQELQSIVLDMCRICVRNGVFLEMEWVPRSRNEKGRLPQ